MVLVTAPMAFHLFQSWVALICTYLFARKRQHPSYISVSVLGVFSWGGWGAMRFHEVRAIRRQARQDALEMQQRAAITELDSPPPYSGSMLRLPGPGRDDAAEDAEQQQQPAILQLENNLV